MRKSLFLIMFFAIVFGCEKDSYLLSVRDLIGEWSWIRSCGGFAYSCYTPATTKQEYTLLFTVDSHVKTYRNDTLKSSVRYHIYQTNSAPFLPNIWINVFEYDSVHQIISISNDTLTLRDFCCDGFSSYYKRVK